MAKGSDNGKPARKELVLDILATTLMDVFALAGVILVIPYAKDDLVGTVAVIVVFVVLAAAYTAIVIGEDFRRLKQG